MKHNGERNILLNRSSFLQRTFRVVGLLLTFVCNLMVTASRLDLISGLRENVTMFRSESGPKNGTFETLGYPKPYPHYILQRFQFRAKPDEVIWITWLDFDLAPPIIQNKQCRDDYVEVIVIDYYNVQHVHGRYCGNAMPPNFTTMQYSVDILFQSSLPNKHRGFRGEYRFIAEIAVPPPISVYPGKTNPTAVGCGGVIQGQYGGEIVSPGYPEDFPANVDCNWVIRVRPDHQVFIKVVELELSPHIFIQCNDAQLVVLDGYALILNESQSLPDHSFQRIVLCGDPDYHKQEGSKSIMSDRNRMVIRFKTTKAAEDQVKKRRREVGSPVGFRLVWTEVSLKTPCTGFLCRGGEYCIDDGKRVCAQRRRYCIDTSLVCDGVPNCAEADDSDEENCYSKEIITAGVALFSLLLLVIIIVVCCQRHRGRKLMQWTLDERVTQETISTQNDINFACSQNQTELSSSDFTKAPLRVALMNKMDKSPLPRNRGGEIAVLPQNCYPARSVSIPDDREDIAVRQPFLAVPNHVPTPSSATSKTTPSSPHFKFSDTDIRLSRGRDSLRKSLRDSKKPSITLTTAPPQVPEINVVRAPKNNSNSVWEHRGSDTRILTPRELTPESLSDNESPLWKEFEPAEKGTAELNVIRRRRSSTSVDYMNDLDPPPPPVFPPVLHEEDDEHNLDSVEMVTFSPRPPPPPLQISSSGHSTSGSANAAAVSRLQGILKSSTSLPPSYQSPVQKLPPSYRAVVSVEISSPDLAAPRRSTSGSTGNTTTVAVHRVPAVPIRTTVMPSTSLTTPEHPRMVRQKAVEFNDQPYIMRRSNAPPPLNLPHSDVSSSAVSVEPNRNNNDRSPSPWHQRVKPTAV